MPIQALAEVVAKPALQPPRADIHEGAQDPPLD
jgi:hypothetical protein